MRDAVETTEQPGALTRRGFVALGAGFLATGAGALDAEAQLRIVAAKDRYEALWDAVLRELQASGEWPAPGQLDRLWLFGALNWSAQWYDRRKGATLDELTDASLGLFIGGNA